MENAWKLLRDRLYDTLPTEMEDRAGCASCAGRMVCASCYSDSRVDSGRQIEPARVSKAAFWVGRSSQPGRPRQLFGQALQNREIR